MNIIDYGGFIEDCFIGGLYSGFLVLRATCSRDQILLSMVRIENWNKTMSFGVFELVLIVVDGECDGAYG